MSIHPDLQLNSKIRKPEAYKRLNDPSIKDQFRKDMIVALKNEWMKLYGSEKTNALVKEFETLAANLDDNGAIDNQCPLQQRLSENLARTNSKF